MKKYYFLIIVALIFGLVLTGCSLLSNIGQAPATNQSGMTYVTKGTEAVPDSFPLYAGQDILVGEVQVWNDADNLYVKYLITEAGWCLTETHLHVAATIEEIPQKNGNPIPGKFDYKGEHECESEVDYVVPLPEGTVCDGDPLIIAAHAVVIKYGTVCVDFEEYDEYDTVSTVSTLAGDVNFYMTDYSGMTDSLGLLNINVGDTEVLLHTPDLFPVVAEEQTKVPDNDYMDLSMQNIVGFTVDTTFEDDWVKSDPDSTGAGGKLLTDPPDFTLEPFWQHAYSNFQAILMDFTQINMPKSVSFAGVDLDWNEVWYILYFDMNNTLIHIATEGPPGGQSGDGVAFPISYSNPDIDKIVIWGNMNGGEPGKVGFAIDNICLEAVIQEETAWAANITEGTLPFDGKNWATYFEYTVECPPCLTPDGELSVTGTGWKSVSTWCPCEYKYDLTETEAPVALKGTVDLSAAAVANTNTGDWSKYYAKFIIGDSLNHHVEVVFGNDWLGPWYEMIAQQWDRIRLENNMGAQPQQYYCTVGGNVDRDMDGNWIGAGVDIYPSDGNYFFQLIADPSAKTFTLQVYGMGSSAPDNPPADWPKQNMFDEAKWLEIGSINVGSVFDFTEVSICAELLASTQAGASETSTITWEGMEVGTPEIW